MPANLHAEGIAWKSRRIPLLYGKLYAIGECNLYERRGRLSRPKEYLYFEFQKFENVKIITISVHTRIYVRTWAYYGLLGRNIPLREYHRDPQFIINARYNTAGMARVSYNFQRKGHLDANARYTGIEKVAVRSASFEVGAEKTLKR